MTSRLQFGGFHTFSNCATVQWNQRMRKSRPVSPWLTMSNVVRSSSRDSSDMAELMNLLSSSSKVGLCASLSLGILSDPLRILSPFIPPRHARAKDDLSLSSSSRSQDDLLSLSSSSRDYLSASSRDEEDMVSALGARWPRPPWRPARAVVGAHGTTID